MKAATLVLLVTGWLFSLTVLQHAQETKPDTSCTPALGADDEVMVAARAYQAFWAAAFEKSAKTSVEPFPGDEIIPAATKLCQNVVKEATEGKGHEIGDAATQVLEAFKYTRENLFRERSKRTKPGTVKLEELYGENPAGITDGFLLKGYEVAQFRFGRLLGPMAITEKEIRAMEDFDFQTEMEKIRSAEATPKNNENVQDHTILVKGDESLYFDGTKVKSDDAMKATLLERVARASKAGKTVRITLQTGEQTKYSRITSVMDLLAAVKITNVTFTVEVEEF